MQKLSLPISILLMGLLLTGAGCFARNDKTNPPTTSTSTPPSSTTTTPPNNPQPQANITVTAPTPNQTISSPVTITGQARVFENAINWDIRDSNGALVASGNAMATAPDIGQFGPYTITTNFPAPTTSTGTVRVFNYSAKDGAMENVVTVPVFFSRTNTDSNTTTSTVVLVFFSNTQKDPNTTACERTYPVQRRIPQTPAVGRASLQELFKGPTAQERSQSYQTNINPGVTINNLTITDGIAHVDVSPTIEQGVGGSCRVAAIRSQITNTLLQFPTVKRVILSVNGRTEDILQP